MLETMEPAAEQTTVRKVPPPLPRVASPWQRVWIAMGVMWSGLCLLGALSLSDNLPVKLALGGTFGAFPWGLWWVLRGFKHWRRILGGFAAFIALLALGLYGLIKVRQAQAEAERLASYKRVPIEQVELISARLKDSTWHPAVIARVRNRNTSHTITALELNVSIYDCATDDEKVPLDRCDLIANPHETVDVRVPPQQSRDIRHDVTVPYNYTVRGHLRWDMDLDRVRAELQP